MVMKKAFATVNQGGWHTGNKWQASKKVARLPLEQKLPVAILHMVMVGDIGLGTDP